MHFFKYKQKLEINTECKTAWIDLVYKKELNVLQNVCS